MHIFENKFGAMFKNGIIFLVMIQKKGYLCYVFVCIEFSEKKKKIS